MLPNGSIKYLSRSETMFGSTSGSISVSIKIMLTQIQVLNYNNLMFPNGSIKSLSRSEKMFGSISGSMEIMLTQFQALNHKDLMLPNGSIYYLDVLEKCQRKNISLTSTHFPTW